MSVDFSKLSKPQMIEEVDFETILSERKEQLIARWTDSADQTTVREILERESEPLTKFLEETAYRETILRNRINQAAQATLLAFATKTDLDAVVANFGITRLLISEATSESEAIYESDDSLRTRASKVFDSLSVAGPTSAYEYHALSANGKILDAKASSPSPCQVVVTLLQNSTTGETSQELIDEVTAYLSDETIRPVGDRLTVKSVKAINFTLNAKIYTSNLPEADTLITDATTAISTYLSEAKRIGRAIYLSKIYNLLHVSGVEHVEILSPQNDLVINEDEVCFCSGISITAGSSE